LLLILGCNAIPRRLTVAVDGLSLGQAAYVTRTVYYQLESVSSDVSSAELSCLLLTVRLRRAFSLRSSTHAGSLCPGSVCGLKAYPPVSRSPSKWTLATPGRPTSTSSSRYDGLLVN